MKNVIYLSMCLFVVIGCNGNSKSTLKSAIFKQGQEITYKVPEFFSLVCTGNGKLLDVTRNASGSYTYLVRTESSSGEYCQNLMIEESDIKAK